VTLPAGASRSLVSVTATMESSTGSESCLMSFAVNGTTPANNSRALILAGTYEQAASATFVVTGLSPGPNTFTANYRGTQKEKECFFSNRSIWAIPLP
jgi:hypothetical protein